MEPLAKDYLSGHSSSGLLGTKCSKRGFTLIELSIVLVIIGLVVGGVMVGQELVYSARIRKMGAELQQASNAINTFRGKYDCLPGDCANATSFFGTNSAGCPAGGGSTGTCDGNGDGFVNGYFGAGNVEHLYVWQQLSFAKLTPWAFAGSAMVGGTGYAHLTPGVNIPQSVFNSGVGYNFYSIRTNISNASKKTIEIGATNTTYPDVLAGAGLTAPQASALDTKFDDGNAQAGKIYAASGGSAIPAPSSIGIQASTVNANTTCVSSGAYLTSSASGCTMEYTPDVP